VCQTVDSFSFVALVGWCT